MRYRAGTTRLATGLAAAALALAACGGDDDDTAADRIEEAVADGELDSEEMADIAEDVANDVADDAGNGDGGDDVAGDDDIDEQVDEMLAGDDEYGSCSATVSGDVSAEWTGNGGAAAVGTDYWYTEDELREQYEFFGDESRSFDDVYASGEPITALLLLNCGTSAPSVSFYPSNATTKDHVPFGPGSYEIAGGGDILGSADAEPGVFTALLSLDDDAVWGSTGGTFEITEWNAEHIAGTFSFGITEGFADPARTAQVDGTFDFRCFATACS